MIGFVKRHTVSLLVVFFVAFSMLPSVYEIARSKDISKGRRFELIHNYYTDYNFYLSRIRQGLEGSKFVYEKYTSEPHNGSFLQIFYLALGWVGDYVRTPWDRPADVYHVARIVFGGALLLMIAEFCRRSFLSGSCHSPAPTPPTRGPLRLGPPGSCHPQKGFMRTFICFFNALKNTFLRAGIPCSESQKNVENGASSVVVDGRRLSMEKAERYQGGSRQARTIHYIFAFLLAVTASSWPKLMAVTGDQVVTATLGNISTWRFGGYMSWWSVMDVLQRITFVPHMLAGQIFVVFLIMALGDRQTMARSGNWIFLGLLAFVLGIIFPPGLLMVGAAAGVMIILEISKYANKQISKYVAWIRESIIPRAIVGIIAAPSLLYTALITSIYPWKRLVEFDTLHPLQFDLWEYLLAIGPVLPLGTIGLGVYVVLGWIRCNTPDVRSDTKSGSSGRPKLSFAAKLGFLAQRFLQRSNDGSDRQGIGLFARDSDTNIRTSVAWLVGWIALFTVFHFVPQQHPLRFSEMLPTVPLAVLAVYGVGKIGELLRGMCTTILIGVIAVGFGQMYSNWLWQKDFVDHKLRATYPLVSENNYVMYPLVDMIDAMSFLQVMTPRDAVILSLTSAGNYIPAYSGNTVYLGHANTVKAEEKESMAKLFFAGNMSREKAHEWLTSIPVFYVFWGPQEKAAGGVKKLDETYPFLIPVYENGNVIVYKVTK